MAIRMTGLMSGLDTESIVEQLMTAHSMKKTKVENSKTKLEWKQEKWQDLNTKLKNLYDNQVSKMRLQSSYQAKKVASSNEAALTATAANGAPSGSNIVTVDKLASAQYVTGSNIKSLGLAKTSKLTEITDSNGNSIEAGTVFTVTSGTGDSQVVKSLAVTADTTVNDFLNTLKDAGLNASFDENQGRFFISSSESGEKNAFTITSTSLSGEAVTGRDGIKDAIGYDSLSSSDRVTVNNAFSKIATGTYQEYYDATNSLQNIVENNVRADIKNKATAYVTDVAKEHVRADAEAMEEITASAQESIEGTDFETKVRAQYREDAKQEIEAQLDEDIANGVVTLEDETQRAVILNQRISQQLDGAVQAKVDDTATFEADVAAARQEALESAIDNGVAAKANEIVQSDEGKAQIAYLEENGLSVSSINAAVSEGIFTGEDAALVGVDENNSFDGVELAVTLAKDTLTTAIEAYRNVGETTGSSTGALSVLGLGEITGSDVAAAADGSGMVVVGAKNSQITLNGAVLTGTTNNFTANGITFNLNKKTELGEAISINVTNDVDATYDMVKGFIKEYNDILKEMNTLYGAESARGYDPLTDDQKEAMTDDQVEKWEKKIKDSLFRNDTTLNSITSAMKNAMASTVEFNGAKYSLAAFGIQTSTDYSEKGLLHIYGDTDDATYSTMDDKLKKALTEDPDSVINVLSGVAKNLYSAMTDKMKTSSISSAFTFYNDKQMNKELKEYSSQISKWTEKLSDMEDSYYKQFSAMEKAMAKLNSQSSYMSSLFG